MPKQGRTPQEFLDEYRRQRGPSERQIRAHEQEMVQVRREMATEREKKGKS